MCHRVVNRKQTTTFVKYHVTYLSKHINFEINYPLFLHYIYIYIYFEYWKCMFLYNHMMQVFILYEIQTFKAYREYNTQMNIHK